MSNDYLRDQTEQVLFEKKMEEVGLFPIGLYEASIPLIETGGMLFIGVLMSGNTPNGQDFLDLTPVQDFEDAADRHLLKTGVNVRTDAFNSYQECLKNPLLVSLKKVSRDEFRDLSRDLLEEE